MKNQFIRTLSLGDTVDDIFVVTRITLGFHDRGDYLRLRLADSSGKISGVMWSGAAKASQAIQNGDLARVEGRVECYRGELQLKVGYLSRVELDSDIDPTDFLPKSRFSPEKLRERLTQIVGEVRDEFCRRILEALLADEELMDGFSRAPGGKAWHHAHIGGLLEHTLCVTSLCRTIAPFYPQVNVDLLVTGAVFHDLGKTAELRYDIALDYTTKGRLVGHVVMGDELLRRCASRVEGFPDETLMYLRHIIISHHGEIDRSPVAPMTLEACLLHYVDNMDAQMTAIIREMEKGIDAGREWTDYITLLGRSLYAGSLMDHRRPETERDEDSPD
ncbi:MAG: HD domain-containing protein [bacterium]